ncbi:hypothetical protein [Cupriavidus gilardii]|uniref:hypothetical protein n=1 Tax=Cupriavidus gilardii TaxID=82541 RepID=UPI000ABE8946|nr:hypothetical protein [Cupriavidus gilardii]
MLKKIIVMAAAASAVALTEAGSLHSSEGIQRFCNKAADDRIFDIKFRDDGAVSVCFPGEEDVDCFYSYTQGKTYLHSRPDLNNDGLPDVIVKDFRSAYGLHEVVHLMAFVQCKDKTFLQVADEMLTDLKPIRRAKAQQFSDLRASRACYDEKLERVRTRFFRLRFDRKAFFYGPPDGDPELSQYCTDKELSLPSSAPIGPAH